MCFYWKVINSTVITVTFLCVRFHHATLLLMFFLKHQGKVGKILLKYISNFYTLTRCGVFHSVALSLREHGSCSSHLLLKTTSHTSSMQRDRPPSSPAGVGKPTACLGTAVGSQSEARLTRPPCPNNTLSVRDNHSNCYWIKETKPQCRNLYTNSAPHVWITQWRCASHSVINKTYTIIITCQLCHIWIIQWPALVVHTPSGKHSKTGHNCFNHSSVTAVHESKRISLCLISDR